MNQGSVTVPVKLTAKGFRDFAVFDTLIRQRRWVMPAVFCAILSASALVCHLLRDRSPNAGVLVAILLVVGVGLPVVYFISFFNSVSRQNRRMGLGTQGAPVYTVTLDGDGVHVEAKGQHMDHPWESVYRVYFRKDAAYLYPSDKQAYLLPYGDVDADALGEMLAAHLPAEKLFGRKEKRV